MEGLIGRLVGEEQYALAVYVAKRCELPAASIWEAWARSLILCAHPNALKPYAASPVTGVSACGQLVSCLEVCAHAQTRQ